MRFSLLKAVKNTHRHPANRILHAIGLSLYSLAILMMLLGYFMGKTTNPIFSLILFVVAIALFLLGHRIEGNLRATTWVILFKYLKANVKNGKKRNDWHKGNLKIFFTINLFVMQGVLMMSHPCQIDGCFLPKIEDKGNFFLKFV